MTTKKRKSTSSSSRAEDKDKKKKTKEKARTNLQGIEDEKKSANDEKISQDYWKGLHIANIRKGTFTAEESAIILSHIEKECKIRDVSVENFLNECKTPKRVSPGALENYDGSTGRGIWHEIHCEKLPLRSPESIWRHAVRSLHSYKRGGWTKEEIQTLVELVETHGNKWSKFESILDRKAEACRDKYRQTKNKQIAPINNNTSINNTNPLQTKQTVKHRVWKEDEKKNFLKLMRQFQKNPQMTQDAKQALKVGKHRTENNVETNEKQRDNDDDGDNDINESEGKEEAENNREECSISSKNGKKLKKHALLLEFSDVFATKKDLTNSKIKWTEISELLGTGRSYQECLEQYRSLKSNYFKLFKYDNGRNANGILLGLLKEVESTKARYESEIKWTRLQQRKGHQIWERALKEYANAVGDKYVKKYNDISIEFPFWSLARKVRKYFKKRLAGESEQEKGKYTRQRILTIRPSGPENFPDCDRPFHNDGTGEEESDQNDLSSLSESDSSFESKSQVDITGRSNKKILETSANSKEQDILTPKPGKIEINHASNDDREIELELDPHRNHQSKSKSKLKRKEIDPKTEKPRQKKQEAKYLREKRRKTKKYEDDEDIFMI